MNERAIADFPVERLIGRRQSNDDWTVVAASRPWSRTETDFSQYRVHPWAKVIPLALSIAIIATLCIGWLNRDDSSLTPKSGVGYSLAYSARC